MSMSVLRPAVGLLLAIASGCTSSRDDKVYRIGVDAAAPYQSWVEGVGPAGYSVDVLSEAARRKGIRLQWLHLPKGPRNAFDMGQVDLWPLVSVNAGKSWPVHTTRPWMQNYYSVVFRPSSDASQPFAEPAWDGARIALVQLPFMRSVAATKFPRAQQVTWPTRREALQSFCRGEATAAFIEERLLEPLLLQRPAGCEGVLFRVLILSDAIQPLATVSTYEAAAVADRLLEGVEEQFDDGSIRKAFDKWFLFSSTEQQVMTQLREARRHNVLLGGVLTGLALLVIALIYAVRRARGASRAKSEFLANVSHEVRTPMNGVLGMLDLLDHTRLTAEQREHVQTVRESAERQLAILNDLLDSAKIEAGHMEMERTAYAPQRLLEELDHLFRSAAEGKGLTWKMEVDSGLPAWVTGDARRLQQVLVNLVNNAIKFTADGSITIRASYQEAALRFAVEDTGLGMSPEVQRKIFDKFIQADSSTTRRFGGTGLGLSIARRLVELMGGKLHLTSQPDVGSTFHFSIPAPVAEAPAKEAEQTRVEAEALRGLRVLVVEDNKTNQRVAAGLLGRMGILCDMANDGREGVSLFVPGRYAAILMDCQMPEMDGYEATRRIRDAETGTHVPIIALTAGASEAERSQALAAGMDAFLAKPVRFHELEAALGRLHSNDALVPRPQLSTADPAG